MNIEWNAIVTNAISALVVAVFLGAATIVWIGATSVDDKVQNTRSDMTHLIDTLSDKLGGYEVQLTSLSNQLMVVLYNQSNIVVASKQVQTSVTGLLSKPLVIPNEKASLVPVVNQEIQQKAYSQELNRQLKRSK